MNSIKISTIFFLSISYVYAAIPTEVEIDQERGNLRIRGEQLHIEKNNAITDSSDLSTLSPSYNIRILDLIKDTIETYRRGTTCVNVSPEIKHKWTKKSLFNIALSSGLLTNDITQPYNSNVQGFMNGNFFDDLRYLIKFRLRDEDPRTNPLYDMPNEQAHELMGNLVMDIVWRTCDLERKAYDDLHAWQLHRTNHRTQYKDHRLLVPLYSFVAHQRERELLSKAIDAINTVNHLQFGAHLSIEQQTINKANLLKTLILIGEICTQKNLSLYTKQIYPHLANNDWQLFINIRNKLAHVEWDIHSRNLDMYLGAHDFTELQPSLQYIEATLGSILITLTNFTNAERTNHYGGVIVPIGAMMPLGTLDPLRAFLVALPQTGNTYNADKAAHPTSFDIISMITRIDDEEITALNRIFNVTGQEVLEDDYPEDMSKLEGTAGVQMILGTLFVLAIEKQLEQPLGAAFYTAVQRIQAYHELENSSLSLELPIDLFYHFPQLIGASGAAQLNLNPLQVRQKLELRFLDYINAVIKYGRNCLLKRSLIVESERVDAACYHFGRIGKFMAEIPVANLIPYMKSNEYRAFRNFIQHGDDLVDILTQKPHDFVIRYTHELLHEIMPNLKDLFLPQPVY
jgi:hypothetical protein